jgi:hypothetical protein
MIVPERSSEPVSGHSESVSKDQDCLDIPALVGGLDAMIQVQKPFPDGIAYKFMCGLQHLLACSLKAG